MTSQHREEDKFDILSAPIKGFYAGNLYVWDSEARYYDRYCPAKFDKTQSEKTRGKFA